ncbi:MAG: type II toxin-antitoxin system RelE/ParE family toxin [Firmicutes bacterium]|nr:type II toxin-antitoxin system RelE/ParE family toxin [Bacillota bacterium]
MKRVEVSVGADLDVYNILSYIYRFSPKNAEAESDKLKNHFENIGYFPGICVPLKNFFDVDTELRRSVVAPYIVITEHYETHIVIHSVFHSKENYLAKLFS